MSTELETQFREALQRFVATEVEHTTGPLRQQIEDQAKVIEELKTRVATLEYAAQPKTMHEAATMLDPISQSLFGKRK